MPDKTDSTVKILIRTLVSSDMEQIIVLENKIFSDPWSKASFEDQMKLSGHGGIVAVSDDCIVGYACYMVVADEGHLTNIAVDPDFRRKSVANTLMQTIFRLVQENSAEFILLEVRPSNKGAIAFYERDGFDLLYRRPVYYHSPVEDALVMVKYFD